MLSLTVVVLHLVTTPVTAMVNDTRPSASTCANTPSLTDKTTHSGTEVRTSAPHAHDEGPRNLCTSYVFEWGVAAIVKNAGAIPNCIRFSCVTRIQKAKVRPVEALVKAVRRVRPRVSAAEVGETDAR